MRIDFYLLSSEEKQAAFVVACRLLEKAYLQKHRVYVYCNNRQDAENIDELLWTFKEDSFIPHHIQGEGPTPPPPIQIAYPTNQPTGFDDLLLNLSDAIPAFYKSFKRVIEIVVNQEEAKAISRSHFRAYRQAGCQLDTHTIK